MLAYDTDPTIRRLTTDISASAPGTWIQSLRATLQPPGTPLIRTLEHHETTVRCVAMTPDGRRAVSGSDDWTIKAWDIDSGNETQSVNLCRGPVFCVAVSADGRQAISVLTGNWPHLVDLQTGKTKELSGNDFSRMFGVAISSDGRLALMASEDKTLRIWELLTGRWLQPLRGHEGPVHCVAISADSRLAISGSEDQTLRLWDLENRREVRTLKGHENSVRAVAMSSDGRVAISAAVDNTVRVWDLRTGRQLRAIEGYAGCFHGIAISADGRLGISALPGARLGVWDVAGRRSLRILRGHYGSIYGVALSSDGTLAISGSTDKTLKVWDLKRKADFDCVGHRSRVTRLSVSRWARRAVTASADSTLIVWDLDQRKPMEHFSAHKGPVDGVAITPNGRYIVSVADSDGLMKFWDFEQKVVFTRRSGSNTAVAVTPDGKRAVSIGWGSLEVRKFPNGRKVRFDGTPPYSLVYGIAISPNGRQMLPACHGYRCILQSLESGKEIQKLRIQSRQFYAVAFSSDGKRALLGGQGGTLDLYDLESERVDWLDGHSGDANVNDVALNPSGHWVASCSDDKTLKVWNLNSNSAVATFTCDAAIHCCAFVDDNELIAGDDLGRVHFLRVNDSQS